MNLPAGLTPMQMAVPQGSGPGSLMQFNAPGGLAQVIVPDGCYPGAQIIVTPVQIPGGSYPGMMVDFMGTNNEVMQVPVPNGAPPGSVMWVPLPLQAPLPTVVAQPTMDYQKFDSETGAQKTPGAIGMAPPTAVPVNNIANSMNPVQQPGGGMVLSKRQEQAPNGGYKDLGFAALFVVHIIIVAYFGFAKGLPFIQNGGLESSSSGSQSNQTPTPAPDSSTQLTQQDIRYILGLSAGALVIAGVYSIMALQVMIRMGAEIITCAIWFAIIGNAVLGLVMFAVGVVVAGIIFLLFAAINFCWYNCVKNRIPFAAANLLVATTSVKRNICSVTVAYFTQFLMVAWTALWVLCFAAAYAGAADSSSSCTAASTSFGTEYSCKQSCTASDMSCAISSSSADQYICQCNSSGGGASMNQLVYFFLLVSLYWGSTTIKNILHVTVAGATAAWYYAVQGSSAVTGAFGRAMTTSFGSICLGSLIVAILKALEQMAREARKQGGAGACVAECILGCLVSLMEYFNRWAFVYVGVYGYDFKTAGKAVFALFKDRGWTAIINDDLIGNVFFVLSLFGGVLCAGVVVGIGNVLKVSTVALIFVGVVGFLLGLLMTFIVMGVVDSAVATIFVCFAEDPVALQTNHNELFNRMMGTWIQFHPEQMQACGYTNLYSGRA